MKNSILSLVNSEGVSLYKLTEILHTSRKAIIHAVSDLQEHGHDIYISHERVYHIKHKDNVWAYVAAVGFGLAFIMAMILAVAV